MLEIDEKPKRKQTPRRYRWWKMVKLILMTLALVISCMLFSLLACLVSGMRCIPPNTGY
jgi:hypothetical protein